MWKDLSYFVYVKVLCMVCLKKMFSNKKKVLDIVAFFGKIHVCLECSSKWTRNYKQKRLAGSV